jgi:hypothetical protein
MLNPYYTAWLKLKEINYLGRYIHINRVLRIIFEDFSEERHKTNLRNIRRRMSIAFRRITGRPLKGMVAVKALKQTPEEFIVPPGKISLKGRMVFENLPLFVAFLAGFMPLKASDEKNKIIFENSKRNITLECFKASTAKGEITSVKVTVKNKE